MPEQSLLDNRPSTEHVKSRSKTAGEKFLPRMNHQAGLLLVKHVSKLFGGCKTLRNLRFDLSWNVYTCRNHMFTNLS